MQGDREAQSTKRAKSVHHSEATERRPRAGAVSGATGGPRRPQKPVARSKTPSGNRVGHGEARRSRRRAVSNAHSARRSRRRVVGDAKSATRSQRRRVQQNTKRTPSRTPRGHQEEQGHRDTKRAQSVNRGRSGTRRGEAQSAARSRQRATRSRRRAVGNAKSATKRGGKRCTPRGAPRRWGQPLGGKAEVPPKDQGYTGRCSGTSRSVRRSALTSR